MVSDVEPFIGMGPIKLGMSRTELRNIMRVNNIKFDFYDKNKNQDISSDHTIFITYGVENTVGLIRLRDSPLHKVFFRGIDLFSLKANDLIAYISQYDSYYINNMSEYGSSYIFKQTGLDLWGEIE